MSRPEPAEKTDPALWERIVAEVREGEKGGDSGEWSARKAQLATAEYKKAGGGYVGPKDPENHLAQWSREEWGTKSGQPSGETGERYLPKAARDELTEAEHAATTRKKRADTKAGRQHSAQPAAARAKAAAVRRDTAAADGSGPAGKRTRGEAAKEPRDRPGTARRSPASEAPRSRAGKVPPREALAASRAAATKAPSGKAASAPGAKSGTAPRTKAATAPRGKAATAPRGMAATAERGKPATAEPGNATPKAPRGKAATAPRGKATPAPRGKAAPAPRDKAAPAPRTKAATAPRVAAAEPMPAARAAFREVVNMTASALERHLRTRRSQEVGFHRPGARQSVGHEMGARIAKLLRRKDWEKFSPDDQAAMRKVAGYIKRHLAQRPADDTAGTNWAVSLRNWGHDPARG